MAFDFPNTPSEGQVYSPPGGPSYTYKNGVWRASAVPLVMATALPKNMLVNPAMQVSQENAQAAGSASSYYAADQWFTGVSLTGGVVSARQNVNNSLNVPAYMLLANVGTAQASIGAGNFWAFQQIMEKVRVADLKWGSTQAVPAVLRFSMHSTMTGTFAMSARSIGAALRSFVVPFVITTANVWADYEIVIPVNTDDVWDVGGNRSLVVSFFMAAGSTYHTPTPGAWAVGQYFGVSGMSNFLANAGNQMLLSNVGLYADPENTGKAPPFITPSLQEDQNDCLRYWQTIQTRWNGEITNGTQVYTNSYMSVLPRAGATLAGVNAAASAFPTTSATLVINVNNAVVESRVANATSSNGFFASTVTVNGRP